MINLLSKQFHIRLYIREKEEKMQISKIDLSLIRRTTPQKVNGSDTINKNITNPFGVSFKGNVIQADVFETKKENPFDLGEKSKLFASALVSGINNFNASFKARVNSVISFGKKITSDAVEAVKKFGNTEITLDVDAFKDTISNKLFPDRQYSVANLSKKPVSELGSMLQSELATV